jgi:2-desacetyl-2-hydroxyethyl bacteriochlorophyllide A dehydrogenase
MIALVIPEPGSIVLTDREKPPTGKGEMLIRLQYVGFCGSDLSTYLGKNPIVNYPRVPGHEISAMVVEVGKEVPEGFSKGDRVTVVPYTACEKCPACRGGRSHACQFNQTLGVQRDGAMQEYLAVPWQKVIKSDTLTELELAMVEPLTVGFHAIERGRVRRNNIVAVFGCGMIGAGAIIRAVLIGARVIAVDIDDHKLDLARALGAHHTVNSMKMDLHENLQKITNGEGPDVIVEAAGNPLTYRAAIEEVAFTGRVVCIGYTGKEVAFATKLFVQKEMDILGSRNATSDDFMAVISYLEGSKFPLEKILTRKVKPEDAEEAMKSWAQDPGKVMKIVVDLIT